MLRAGSKRFFLKKEAKTFYPWLRALPGGGEADGDFVRWLRGDLGAGALDRRASLAMTGGDGGFGGCAGGMDESFLVLFFKKERACLASFRAV
jgi:hypothetical protein